MNKNAKRILSTLGFIVLIAGLLWSMWYFARPPKPAADLAPFAQCLASKQATMYGAYWCPHCKNQKALFGDAFRYVPYVECTEQAKLCADKGVEGYPTWIIPGPDGAERKFPGEKELIFLSEQTGCPLPSPSN